MILDILGIGAKLIDKVLPDAEAREKAKFELIRLEQMGEFQEMKNAMKVVTAEVQGESWLQRNWRPITMLTFVGLVVAKWLGFTAPGVSEQVELELMRLIQIGIGGYIVSRGAEKGIKTWKNN